MSDFIPLKNFEGYYEINSCGEIKSLKRNGTKGGILKVSVGKHGYAQVSLRKSGEQITKTVHRLVAENFISNPENKPCVNHINGIKTDNRKDNLEWVTYPENTNHAYKNGLTIPLKGEDKSKLRNDDILNIVKLFNDGTSFSEISKITKIPIPTIKCVINGRSWTHLTGIDREPNPNYGRFPKSGIKGVMFRNNQYTLYHFIDGENHYVTRCSDLDMAIHLKNELQKMLDKGLSIKLAIKNIRALILASGGKV